MLEIHLGKRCYLVDHSCIFLQSLTYNLEKKKKPTQKKASCKRKCYGKCSSSALSSQSPKSESEWTVRCWKELNFCRAYSVI